MGKCLSCCEQPDETHRDNHSKKGNSEELTGHIDQSGTDVFGQTGDRNASTLCSNDNNEPNNKSHSKALGSGAITANNEKSSRMFYSRIPPILSVGGGEAKRANQNKECSESKILAFYEQYRDPHEDAILSEGIEKLCHDLEVKPEEFKVLVLAWKFKAETMCKFTRSEFVAGCKSLKVCNVKGIQSKFPEMLLEVEDPDNFKDLYRFTFGFGLDAEVGQRILPSDMAIILWKLIFSQREPPLLHKWLTFLERHPSVRGVPRDTWNMFLNFLEAVGDDLSTYDDAEAWPSLFDDFVDYVACENDQTNQNVQRKDENELRII